MSAAKPGVPWLLVGCGALVVAVSLGCQGAAYLIECDDDEFEAFGQCFPITCAGDNPFGSYSGAEVVFVHPDADLHGHGTEEMPYLTLWEGLSAAAQGQGSGIVVVGSGTYPEQIALDDSHDGIQVIGVCAEQTFIEGPDVGIGLVGSPSTEVEVRDVTVRDTGGVGVYVSGGTLTLSGVIIEDSVGMGVWAIGPNAELDLTDSVVSGTRAMEVDAGEPPGFGILVQDGALADIANVTVELSELVGIYGTGANTEVSTNEVLIAGSQVGLAGRGAGIVLDQGASGVLFDTEIRDVWEVGVLIEGDGSLLMQRSTISGVFPGGNNEIRYGVGLWAAEGASVTANDVTVHRTSLTGVRAQGQDTVITLKDSVVGQSLPDAETDGAGVGLLAEAAARIEATGLLVEGAAVYGARAVGATLSLTDAEIIATLPTDRDPVGVGVAGEPLANWRSTLSLFDVTVREANTLGMLVEGSSATLTHVAIEDVGRGSSQTTAVGLVAEDDAVVVATDFAVSGTEGPGFVVAGTTDANCTRCVFDDNAFAGVLLTDAGDLDIDGGAMRGNGFDATEGGGVGLHVQSNPGFEGMPKASVADCEVRNNTHAGVHITGPATVELTDNDLFGGTSTRAVWPAGTAVYARGTGLSDLVLSGNELRDSEGAAVFLDGATATLNANLYNGNQRDVVQQLCDASIPEPAGMADEPFSIPPELCPEFDFPVESFHYDADYVPPELK